MACDYACLRPEFTQQLVSQLQSHRCVNLISLHGQGRRRTLQDLKHVLPKHWLPLQVDMRAAQHDVGEPLAVLCSLYAQAIKDDISNIDELIKKSNEYSAYILIIIHNFELLNDDGVVSALNKLYQNDNILLLCVFEKKSDTGLSNAVDCYLPSVTHQQLMQELARRFPSLSNAEYDKRAAWLLQQSAPYSQLDIDVIDPMLNRA